jgi:tRNA pseudouridine65 synthase
MSEIAALPIRASGQRWAVADKPSGMVVHPSHYSGQFYDTAVQILAAQLGHKVFAVHRLDAATSGLLLVAFDSETVAHLARQFHEHTVHKRYLAVARGWLPSSGVIDHPLADDRGRLKPAVTRWSTLAQASFEWPLQRYPQARYTLLAAAPEDGRQHQIRRHFKHLSHPLIGDTRYGKGEHNRLFRDNLACSRLLLHAAELGFVAPDGQPVHVVAPLEPVFERVMAHPAWRWITPQAPPSTLVSPTEAFLLD